MTAIEKLSELGFLIKKTLENLAGINQEEKIVFPVLGAMPRSTLQLSFQIIWECLGGAARDKLLIKTTHLHSSRLFLLMVRDGGVENFQEVSHLDGHLDIKTLSFDVKKLEQMIDCGWLSFILTLLQGKGVSYSEGESWYRLVRKIQISPTSLSQLVKWLFPFSGMGLLIFTSGGAIPLVFYGGSSPQLKICLPRKSSLDHLVSETKQFRFDYHLAIAIGVNSSSLAQLLLELKKFGDFFSQYNKDWSMSIPLEVDDFLQHLDVLKKIVPYRETLTQCHIDKEHLQKLLKNYLKNALNYLQHNDIYLKLQENNKYVILKLTSQELTEVFSEKDIDPKDLFTLKVDNLATILAWLNDKSLRLLTSFIDAIIPAEISQKVHREEILLHLKLKDKEEQEFNLFISGGDHSLYANHWCGDFSAILLTSNGEIIWKESLKNVPFTLIEENYGYQVFFPPDSILFEKSLFFYKQKQKQISRGLKRFISDTSLLTKIAPGLRTHIITGSSKDIGTLNIDNNDYQCQMGFLNFYIHSGRYITYASIPRHLTHCWLFENQGGFCVAGADNNLLKLPDWWQEFLLSSEKYGLHWDKNIFYTLENKDLFLPSLSKEGLLKIKSKVGFLFKNKFISLNFFLLDAWAVPCNQQGNFILRIRSLVKLSKNWGFALLELPCILPGLQALDEPTSLTLKPDAHGVAFYIEDVYILRINNKKYLRPFLFGWRHKWNTLKKKARKKLKIG